MENILMICGLCWSTHQQGQFYNLNKNKNHQLFADGFLFLKSNLSRF
jgi:hypothetical protein